jgi:hypothetical protein
VIENNVMSNSRLMDFAVNPEGVCARRFFCQFCDFSPVKLIELGQHKINIMVFWIPTFSLKMLFLIVPLLLLPLVLLKTWGTQ